MKYANIKYSKELKDWFPESEWFVVKTPDGELHFKLKHEAELMYLNAELADAEGDTKICFYDWEIYPALTTDMLLERLPGHLKANYKRAEPDGNVWDCGINTKIEMLWEEGWIVRYVPMIAVKDKSLPNALAKMLLWLINQGLIKEER